VDAAYGGVYTCSALAWLWIVDRVTPSAFDIAGVVTIAAGSDNRDANSSGLIGQIRCT
jgi:drug/metabolite transporter superfamily protein YnfA